MKLRNLALTALFCAASANADEIYTYQGNPLDTGGAVSGSFTLPDALPVGMGNAQITPQSFAFTWNTRQFDQTNSTFAEFFFSTDADGNLLTWNITLETGAATLLTEYYGSAFEATDAFASGSFVAMEEGNRGTWSAVDPPSATPEPSTLVFLFAGLLAILRRR